jgi:hypothetical protein
MQKVRNNLTNVSHDIKLQCVTRLTSRSIQKEAIKGRCGRCLDFTGIAQSALYNADRKV